MRTERVGRLEPITSQVLYLLSSTGASQVIKACGFTRFVPQIGHPIDVIGLMFMLASALTVGTPMPKLEGENLSGHRAVLPDAARGKVTLVAMGFNYESRRPVEAWTKRFRHEFGQNPDTAFFEVPMISGMARLAKLFIDSGMRRGTAKEDHDKVITVYGGASDWKQRLGAADKDAVYLILLDREGRVRWRHSGLFDENVWPELKEATEAALQSGQ
jgi:hypothetical protein